MMHIIFNLSLPITQKLLNNFYFLFFSFSLNNNLRRLNRNMRTSLRTLQELDNMIFLFSIQSPTTKFRSFNMLFSNNEGRIWKGSDTRMFIQLLLFDSVRFQHVDCLRRLFRLMRVSQQGRQPRSPVACESDLLERRHLLLHENRNAFLLDTDLRAPLNYLLHQRKDLRSDCCPWVPISRLFPSQVCICISLVSPRLRLLLSCFGRRSWVLNA